MSSVQRVTLMIADTIITAAELAADEGDAAETAEDRLHFQGVAIAARSAAEVILATIPKPMTACQDQIISQITDQNKKLEAALHQAHEIAGNWSPAQAKHHIGRLIEDMRR